VEKRTGLGDHWWNYQFNAIVISDCSGSLFDG